MTTKFTGNITSSGSLVATQTWVNSQGYGAGAGGSIDGLSDVDTTTSAPSTGQVLKWDGSNWTPQTDSSGSGYNDASVDTHLNQTNPTSGHVLSWNGSDYAWVSNAGYSNSDVDTHLNQSNPTSGHVLSWNGSDYAWVANSSGSTDLNSLSAGTISTQNDSIAFIDANDGESSKKESVVDFLTAIAGSGITVSSGQLTAGTANNPGGANTQVQFNDSSSFGGDSDFTYNKTTNTLTVVNLNATSITTTGSGSTTISAGANVELNATNRVLVTDTPFRLASFTTTTRNAISSPVNGDMIYNSTTNQLESYENSAWVATAGSSGGATTWANITNINNASGPAKIEIGTLSSAGSEAVAIGKGTAGVGDYAQAIGNNAGNSGQGVAAVAIGSQAGETNQGTKAVALGQYAGQTSQAANSIVINATGSALQNTTASSLVVKPIRNASGTHSLEYNPTTGEVTYDTLAGGGGIASVVADTTPQLGGDLDINGKTIAHTFTLGANGSSDYTFSDAGNIWFPTTENDPVLYLRRGEQYIFVNSSGGSHPFQIRVSNGGSAYNTGVTNNGASSGNIIFKVPMSAPATLYYQCTSHSGMGNTINIV